MNEQRVLHRWQVGYLERDKYRMGLRDLSYREVEAATPAEAMDLFMRWVFDGGPGVQAGIIGEQDGSPVFGFPLSVWSGEAWVDPVQLGFAFPHLAEGD